MTTQNHSAQRNEMVEQQIVARGVSDRRVLDAMRTVPRAAFLPESLRKFAYDDGPVPIAAKQTVSQPYMVAFMVELLGMAGGETVLEIGAGSGYAAAVLAEIAGEVYTVERIKRLADSARETLRSLNYHNVHVRHGDGTRGWLQHAPFDAIIVAAGGPRVPESLRSQLKIGGRLVIPVGKKANRQRLIRITRESETEFKTEDIASVRFVPLIGDEAWKPAKQNSDSSHSEKTRDLG